MGGVYLHEKVRRQYYILYCFHVSFVDVIIGVAYNVKIETNQAACANLRALSRARLS